MLQCMSIPPCVKTTQTCPRTGLEVRNPKQVSRGQKPRCWQGCGPSRGPSIETASWPSQPPEVRSPRSWGPSVHRQSWQQHPLARALSHGLLLWPVSPASPSPKGPLWLQGAHLGSPGQSHRKIPDLVTSQQPPRCGRPHSHSSGGQDADILGRGGHPMVKLPQHPWGPSGPNQSACDPARALCPTSPHKGWPEVHSRPQALSLHQGSQMPTVSITLPPWAHPKTP